MDLDYFQPLRFWYLSPLENVCKTGDIDKVDKYICKLEGVHKTNYWNDGLLTACECGNVDIVQLMINMGAFLFDHALNCAFGNGRLNVIHFLIEHGLTIQHVFDFDICFAISCATEQLQSAQLLLHI